MSLLIATIGVLILFSFWNGFTDAANAISTIIGTRVLTPIKAVALAAFGNFLGAALGVAVATTIGKGILVSTDIVTAHLVMAAIVGGLIWDVITWYWGIPCSETHVLVGGLVGAGLAAVGFSAINYAGVFNKIVIPMIFSPAFAIIIAFILTGLVVRSLAKYPPFKINKYFKNLQILSSLFLSVTHGSNDAQKVVGVMTALLLSYGVLTTFSVPLWVIVSSYSAISIGTFFGGWRIVKTMAFKVTNLKPYQGFCAETGAALILAGTAQFGLPVSTTHVTAGSIMGVGAAARTKGVRWKVARNIIWTWVFTMPASAFFAYLIYFGIKMVI